MEKFITDPIYCRITIILSLNASGFYRNVTLFITQKDTFQNGASWLPPHCCPFFTMARSPVDVPVLMRFDLGPIPLGERLPHYGQVDVAATLHFS